MRSSGLVAVGLGGRLAAATGVGAAPMDPPNPTVLLDVAGGHGRCPRRDKCDADHRRAPPGDVPCAKPLPGGPGHLGHPLPACDPGTMTSNAELLNEALRSLVRLADRPGAALVRVAGLGVGVFALLGLVYRLGNTDPSGWLPFALAAVLAVPVVVLAVRRWRLRALALDAPSAPTVTPRVGEVVVPGTDDGVPHEPVAEAIVEGRIRTARFMPRVEAAQRAAVAAAGGTVNAPYLRDDLRVTIAALIGTLAAIPLSTLGSIVTAIVLLSA